MPVDPPGAGVGLSPSGDDTPEHHAALPTTPFGVNFRMPDHSGAGANLIYTAASGRTYLASPESASKCAFLSHMDGHLRHCLTKGNFASLPEGP